MTEGRERDGRWTRPLKGNSECAQEMLSVAAADDVSHRDPKGKPVQMPEYLQ